MVLCPECENNLDVEEEEVDEGEVISCPECGTDFEVVTANSAGVKGGGRRLRGRRRRRRRGKRKR